MTGNQYYAIGYAPDDLVVIQFRFDYVELTCVPNKVIYNIDETLPTIFSNLAEASEVLNQIQSNNKMWLQNNSIIDSILEEENGGTSHSAANLKIFSLKVEEVV